MRLPEDGHSARFGCAGARGRWHPRFSLAHLTILGAPPPGGHRDSRRTPGYDFVSLRIIPMRLPNEPNYDLGRDPAMLRETTLALSTTGLKLHDIEPARIADGVDVKSYAPALEIGAELGARRVISSIWTPNAAYALDALGELCGIEFRLHCAFLVAARALCREVVATATARRPVQCQHPVSQ